MHHTVVEMKVQLAHLLPLIQRLILCLVGEGVPLDLINVREVAFVKLTGPIPVEQASRILPSGTKRVA
jgi:hypothetical protein